MTRDKSGIFEPQAKAIIKIFGDTDSFYHIPEYQRPYSWRDDQIQQLIDDVFDAMQSGDESYFLGPMILIRKPDGYYEVVDGQQRLTTLTILFCVIRDLYGNELRNENKALAKHIENLIKSEIEERHRVKLITQMQQQNQFEQEILNGVRFPKAKQAERIRKRDNFLNAALLVREKLAEVEQNDGIAAIKKFAEYLLKNVEVISIVCLEERYAIRLFEILNTRGLDLSHADLIKSHLYGRLGEELEKKKFIATWDEVNTVAKRLEESLSDLLTYYEYYLLARNPKRALYEELKEQFKDKHPNRVIFDFRQFVDSFEQTISEQSKLMFSFYYLPNQIFWKSILATAQKSNLDEFEELQKELRKVYYSYWIAGYTTTKIKHLSFNLIDLIKAGRPMQVIKSAINEKLSKDKVITRMKEKLEDEVYGLPWLRPLLTLIEYEQSDDARIIFINLDRNTQVDHILPKEWRKKDDWRKLWDEKPARYWLNRLGNMTLLSGRKNILASNDPFYEKKAIYKGRGYDGTTSFLISQRIIESDKWGEDEVRERHKWLTDQISRLLDAKLS